MGDRLQSDSLQFGFKRGYCTSSATWLVQEVIQQFLRAGSKPNANVLDCSKAFNLVKFNILFARLLMDRQMPAVVVRVLAFSYKEQLAWVRRWERRCTSSTFGISKGTRQGSVASPAFWLVYLDPLFAQLRREGVGCHLVPSSWVRWAKLMMSPPWPQVNMQLRGSLTPARSLRMSTTYNFQQTQIRVKARARWSM